MAKYRPLLAIIYLVVGAFLAWDRGYINEDVLRRLISALLAIFLWFLLLLDVDLHIDG